VDTHPPTKVEQNTIQAPRANRPQNKTKISTSIVYRNLTSPLRNPNNNNNLLIVIVCLISSNRLIHLFQVIIGRNRSTFYLLGFTSRGSLGGLVFLSGIFLVVFGFGGV
jgi:hypothetical protein